MSRFWQLLSIFLLITFVAFTYKVSSTLAACSSPPCWACCGPCSPCGATFCADPGNSGCNVECASACGPSCSPSNGNWSAWSACGTNLSQYQTCGCASCGGSQICSPCGGTAYRSCCNTAVSYTATANFNASAGVITGVGGTLTITGGTFNVPSTGVLDANVFVVTTGYLAVQSGAVAKTTAACN